MSTPDPSVRADLWQDIINAAKAAGTDAGQAAATWFEIDDADAARRILTGIEDGDPEVLDSLPYCDLSGQWADGLNPRDIVAEACSAADVDPDPLEEWHEEIVSAFQDACNATVFEETERRCREILAPTDPPYTTPSPFHSMAGFDSGLAHSSRDIGSRDTLQNGDPAMKLHSYGRCCTDCLMFLANGETPIHMGEDETAEWMAEIGRRAGDLHVGVGGEHFYEEGCRNVTADGEWIGSTDCDCETQEFTWQSCDTCGSTLGGSRHAVHYFEVTDPATRAAETLGLDPAADYFDAAQGLHWFCAENHEGMTSEEYRVLSALQYRPSSLERGPAEDSPARDVYDALENGEVSAADVLAFVERGQELTREA